MVFLTQRIILPLLLLGFLVTPAHAEEFDPVSSGFKMMGGLLVVLAIILGLYYLLRSRVSAFRQPQNGAIKIVEIRHIMPKKTLMLIEVRGKEYLVGAGSDSINTITPLQSGDYFASLLEKSEEEQEI